MQRRVIAIVRNWRAEIAAMGGSRAIGYAVSILVPIVMVGAVLLAPATGWCAEGAGEAAGGGSWTSLLFYVINFALFIWFLAHFAGPAARKFFADRAGGIRENFARAESTYTEAQDLAKRAADAMSRLEAEKQQLRADLDAETAYIANRIRELARETAARIVHDTEVTAAAVTEDAQRRVRATLAAATGRIARELMVKSFSNDDQARLLRGFEERLAQEARR
jgi:F0F1-type ATP synthase membrane subunit b/b'